jgi:DNA-binding response OmpR family regulator
VVEDDAAIRRGLVDALRFHGYDVLESGDVAGAVRLGVEDAPDLIVLDRMLPDGSGLDAMRRIRAARPRVPILLLTALGSEDQRVEGLAGGADDYIVKPFGIRELFARIDAVLRRSPGRPTDVRGLGDGVLRADLERGVLVHASSESPLPERDAAVLRFLAMHRDRVVERSELLQGVWGLDPRGIETRTVDMQMARLRDRLASAGAAAEWIETARGRGYRLAATVAVEA